MPVSSLRRPVPTRLLGILLVVGLLLAAAGPSAAAATPAPTDALPRAAAQVGATSNSDAAATGSSADDALEATPAATTPSASSSDIVSLDDPGGTPDPATGDEAAPRDERERATPPAPRIAVEAIVDADVSEALADDDSYEVAVLVRLREQPDGEALTRAGEQAGAAAAREALGRAARGGPGAAAAAADARQAAHEARVSAVVERLQELSDRAGRDVAALLAEREAAGGASDVREYWIFSGFAATVDAETLDALTDHPDVDRILLDRTIELPEVTSEPRLPVWGLEAVAAPRTWGEYGVRGDGIVVGVLDSGADGQHPALAGTYRGRDGDHASSWYVPTGENYPTPGDGHGHGTHVTGSITGGAPGEIIGVAPEAEWIGIKIFTDAGSTSDSIIADGMQWALAPGGDPTKAPHVVNNSWGAADATRDVFWDEVDAWVAAGIFPVVSNGNAGPGAGTVGSPASYPDAFGVGATDIDDVIAGFSSRGPAFWDGERYLKPQISAPGANVWSAWPTQTGEPYRALSGTSMAAPHASGVAALVLSASPGLSIEELRDVLQETARTEAHMGELPNDTYGHGIIDAFAATTRVTISGVLTGTVTGPDGPIEAEVTVADTDDSTVSDPETGAYVLYVPEGERTVTIDAYGYLPVTTDVTIVAGEVTELDVTLDAADSSELTVTVTADGEPVRNATVTLEGTPLEPLRTDASGTATATVAHGTYDLRVTAHGYRAADTEVTVDGPTSVTVTLEPLDQSASPGWRAFQNDARRTGFTDTQLDPSTFDRAWTTELGGNVVFSSPVLGDDTVYVTTEDGRLHALDMETGEVRWRAAAGGMLRSTPAVTDDAIFLGGGDDATLHALDPADGSTLWTYATGDERLTYATPAVVDGTVYVSTGFGDGNGGFVHAVDATTGDQRWRGEVGPQIFFGPVVADGLVIAASRQTNRITAFDADTGDEVWSVVDQDTTISMPAVADGVLYLSTSTNDFASGSVVARDVTTGEQLWRATGHGDSQGSSPVIYDDLVIAGSHSQGTVTAYDRATGARAWRYAVGTAVTSAQLVTAGGVLIGGSQDGRVWALDATSGSLLWSDEMTDNILSAPAAADGTMVISDRRGAVAAYVSTGTLEVTVTGPDGPLEADVRVVETDRQAATDPETGVASFAHPAGEVTVEVRAYGFEQASAEATIEVGATTSLSFELAPVDDGALEVVVTDEAGDPLAGAEAVLRDTPLDPAVTGDDGTASFDVVAAGTYHLDVDADGYASESVEVTIEAGATTNVEVALTRYDVAVVADHEDAIGAILRGEGWRVDSVSWDDIDGTVDRYGAVVLAGNGQDRTDEDLERLARVIADSDAAGVSLVVLDQWSLAYGSLRPYAQVTGDPSSVSTEFRASARIWLEDVVAHPLTASLPEGERVQLLTRGDHAWFDGYGGITLGTLGTDATGQRGGGLGYEARTFTSAHVLLPVHAPTPWAGPNSTWLPAMTDLLVDSVDYAVGAAYGEVAGSIIDAEGDPVDANVTVVDGAESTTAEDGDYALLLSPGTTTLRVEALGYEPQELEVDVTAGETTTLDITLSVSGLGTITGTVTDEATGDPIAGATVTVEGTELPPATSGANGVYTVGDVPGGTYDLLVEADGFLPTTVEDVEVVDGQVTTADVALALAPVVAVVGDYQSQITDFLTARDVPAFATDWSVVDDLDDVDVVVLHNPANITDPQVFLDHLAAFDAAGVSVIFPTDGWATRTRGMDLLVRHVGDPESFGRIGGISGPQIFLHDIVADHPIFAGIDDGPMQLLTSASEAGTIQGYSGIQLATVAAEGSDPAGIGVAYDPRTPDSVHVLLSGLAATLRNNAESTWTDDGKQVFLNAVRFAAQPRLARLSGTLSDPDEEPIEGAVVSVEGTQWEATTGEDGTFALGVPAGTYQVTFEAFGYVAQSVEITVEDGETLDLSRQLDVADVGDITGVVTSGDTGIDPTPTPLAELPDVEVRLLGTPLTTTTDEDGSYAFSRVEPGTYELEFEVEGHVHTLIEVEVEAGTTTERDVALRPSPDVGIIDDSDFSNSRDRGKQFLEEWGYHAEDVDWDDLDRIAELDLVVANISAFPNPDPGADGFAAFMDVVNRAGIPVLWMDQSGRGAIQYLVEYDGDPGIREQGTGDGDVTATVVEPHPLVQGLPDTFELTQTNRHYAYFDDFSGTTVATLATDDTGELGDTIGFRGRTARTVDVLLSTLAITTWGAPSTEEHAALYWTPEAERVLVNALAWAFEGDGIGAEARVTVQDEDGERIPSTIEVLETGRTHPGREGDGTAVVPLDPGTWTLEVSSFAYETVTVEVTVAAGETATPTVTLPAGPAGDIAGTVTDTGGAPIEGATVRVLDTERVTETTPDGSYTLSTIPEGDWTVEFRADGYQVHREDVTIEDGATLSLDVALTSSSTVALAGDRQTDIHDLLVAEGYDVETYAYNALDELAAEVGSYALVILNGTGTVPSEAMFTALLDAAADADVSVVFPGQFGSGSIRHLTSFTGDPESVTQGFRPESIGYEVVSDHPIFGSFSAGDTITLLTNPGANQQFQSFSGYSGTELARTVSPESGENLGGGLAYRFASGGSVHLLLGNLAASAYGTPTNRWTDDARTLYLDAIAWAIDAAQGEVAGTITGDGDPLAGATVTAVEEDSSTTTDADGTYSIGLPAGEHTIEASADGYETASATVTVGDEGVVEVDLDLARLPRGELEVTVVAEDGGDAIADATVTIAGPISDEATTDDTGTVGFADLEEGTYTVTVEATGYLEVVTEATVVADEVTTLTVELAANDVAVLGDVDGVLTEALRELGEAAEARTWDELADDLGPYRVLVANGGAPDDATIEAVLDAADEAGVSIVFGGTWGVDRGAIRLLERVSDDVVVGGQGYADGPVSLTGFDPEHPLFEGIDSDTAIVADDGYYSWLAEHPGEALADLVVDGDTLGTAASFAFRGPEHGHLLLSVTAVSELQGPGYGWTDGTAQLLGNAIDWIREVEIALPDAPTLTVDDELVADPVITVTGTADPDATLDILRDDEVVVTDVEVADDGTYSAEVELTEGENVLVARSTNEAGSVESDPVTVWLDTLGPVLEWTPEDGDAVLGTTVTVEGTATDEPAGVDTVEVQGTEVAVDEEGWFSTEIELEPGANDVTVVATDTLGNVTTETRTVGALGLDDEWEVSGNGPSRNVQLTLSDADGSSTRVDGVDLEVHTADGDVLGPYAMRWAGQRYQHVVRQLPSGTHQLHAVVEHHGWTVHVDGPELTVR